MKVNQVLINNNSNNNLGLYQQSLRISHQFSLQDHSHNLSHNHSVRSRSRSHSTVYLQYRSRYHCPQFKELIHPQVLLKNINL